MKQCMRTARVKTTSIIMAMVIVFPSVTSCSDGNMQEIALTDSQTETKKDSLKLQEQKKDTLGIKNEVGNGNQL